MYNITEGNTMNNYQLKIVGKGRYKLVKNIADKTLSFYYDDRVVETKPMIQKMSYYTHKRLVYTLNKFVNSIRSI